MQALCRPGDEVVLPSPYWVTYREQAMMAGASVVEVKCPQSNNFLLQPEQLAEAITPTTRLVILREGKVEMETVAGLSRSAQRTEDDPGTAITTMFAFNLPESLLPVLFLT